MNKRKLQASVINCTEKFKEFFNFSLNYLKENEKELIIHPGQVIRYKDDPADCCGWCDGDSIEIARDFKLFEETYVHEFCHMEQAVQDSYAWQLGQESTMWEDLESNRSDIALWNEILKVLKMERDCERRVLEKNLTWKLFDAETYAKQANIYLYFYHYVYLTRKWHNSSLLYSAELLDKMPPKLLTPQELNKIDMKVMMLYDKILKVEEVNS
jgi:hypothetical protein